MQEVWGQDTCRTYTVSVCVPSVEDLGRTLLSAGHFALDISPLRVFHSRSRRTQIPFLNCKAEFWLPVCKGVWKQIKGSSVPGDRHSTQAHFKWLYAFRYSSHCSSIKLSLYMAPLLRSPRNLDCWKLSPDWEGSLKGVARPGNTCGVG